MHAVELNWSSVAGGANRRRLAIAQAALDRLPPEDQARAHLVECKHEFTGERYGKAACRAGRCVKIGVGGRISDCTTYQLWLVWN